MPSGFSSSLVVVTVMDVGIMRMGVFQARVMVRMRVRFLAVPIEIVLMLVMAVVAVFMHMVHWRMGVLVFMGFGQVQPDAAAHQCRRRPE